MNQMDFTIVYAFALVCIFAAFGFGVYVGRGRY